MSDHSHSVGGCATEAVFTLLLIYILFHLTPIVAFLDRVLR